MKSRLLALFALIICCAQASAQKIGLEIGDIAPDIAMTSPEGKSVSISQLRGKIVIVEFWASFCGPCRANNPAIVRCHKKYGDRLGLFGISLDVNAKMWKKAIVADRIEWGLHGCDLGGFDSKAVKKFGISSIPANMILDAKGKIIAKNIRGAELESFLTLVMTAKNPENLTK